MIEVRKIWDDIKKAGLEEYVSMYEIWIAAKELKEYLKTKKILIKRGAGVLYFLIFLYGIAMLAGVYYIYQGVSTGVIHRCIYGIAIVLIGFATLYIWIGWRNRVKVYLLEDGILAGIIEKKITRTYGYAFSFLPYSGIKEIKIKKISSDLRTLEIHTKDNKLWLFNNRTSASITINKKKVKHYLDVIYNEITEQK